MRLTSCFWRHWLLALVFIGSHLVEGTGAAALEVPRLTGRVVDNAGILSAADRKRISDLLKTHEDQTSNQVTVLTVPSIGETTIDQYATAVFDSWKLGLKEKDNGVLLVVAVAERKMRIEVGYGLEGALPDSLCGQIIRLEIAPHFKRGDFSSGVLAGVQSILGAIRGEYRPAGAKGRKTLVAWLRAYFPGDSKGGDTLYAWLRSVSRSVPIGVQVVVSPFFWLFSVFWFFAGPTVFTFAGKPVRLGVFFWLPGAAVFVFFFPGMIAPAAFVLAVWLEKRNKSKRRKQQDDSPSSAGDWSSNASDTSSSDSSSSSSDSSSDSFSGGGGRSGGGGASGSW